MNEASQQAPIATPMIGEQCASIARKINYHESSDALTPLASFKRTARYVAELYAEKRASSHLFYSPRAAALADDAVAAMRNAVLGTIPPRMPTLADEFSLYDRNAHQQQRIAVDLYRFRADVFLALVTLFMRSTNVIQKCRGSVVDVKEQNKRPNDKSDNNRCIDFRTWPC